MLELVIRPDWAEQIAQLRKRLTEGEVSYIVNDCGAKAVVSSRAMAGAASRSDSTSFAVISSE